MSDKTHRYFPVPGAEKSTNHESMSENVLESYQGYPTTYDKRRSPREIALRVGPWALHLLLFTVSICAGLLVSRSSLPEYCRPEKSDALLGQRQAPVKVRFNGSFDGYSPYKGPPSPEVDRAWDRILPLGLMDIPESIFRNLNASKHSVKTPGSIGNGRFGIFDTVHHLHCVRALWKLAYPEYYNPNGTSSWSKSQKSDWYNHINHCTDMLRQKLMCDASSAIITYNWLENHYHPHPNFNVEQKCRNYNELVGAAAAHQLPRDLVPIEGFFREGFEEVVEFKEPPFDPNDEGTKVAR